MFHRASILLAAALFAGIAQGESVSDRWHATAVPWNGNLPVVEVTLGYPGVYLPTDNCPIELRVGHAKQPFDGFIGFRFTVKRRSTRDVPVLSRAIIAAGKRWEFRTTVQLLKPLMTAEDYRNPAAVAENRDLVVIWYDAALHRIAEANVGRPPWAGWRDLHALRIVGPLEQPGTATLLGRPAAFSRMADLPAEAQWYRGFKGIVVPVELWLDLPPRIREVIFHSGTAVLFFGAPRAGQELTELDRAMLPVVFTDRPSQVPIPSLFRKGASSLASRSFWRATADSSYAGSSESPYLVQGKISTFAAEEAAFAAPLPAWPEGPESSRRRDHAPPVVGGRIPLVAREFRALLMVLAALILSIIVWVLARKNRLIAAIALSLLSTTGIFAFRAEIRRSAAVNVTDKRQWITPAVSIHTWSERAFGRSPLAAADVPADVARTWSSSNAGNRQTAEIRASGTMPGHGTVLIDAPWDSTMRVRSRQELAPQPLLKIIRADAEALTLERPPSIPAEFVYAIWIAGGEIHEAARIAPKSSPVITLRKGDTLPSFIPTWSWLQDFRASRSAEDIAWVWFVAKDGGTTAIHLLDSTIPGTRRDRSLFRLAWWLEPQTSGFAAGTFVLPAERSGDLESVITIRLNREAKLLSATIIAANGTIDLLAPPAQLLPPTIPGEQRYALAYERLLAISPPGDVLRADVRGTNISEPPYLTILTRRPMR